MLGTPISSRHRPGGSSPCDVGRRRDGAADEEAGLAEAARTAEAHRTVRTELERRATVTVGEGCLNVDPRRAGGNIEGPLDPGQTVRRRESAIDLDNCWGLGHGLLRQHKARTIHVIMMGDCRRDRSAHRHYDRVGLQEKSAPAASKAVARGASHLSR